MRPGDFSPGNKYNQLNLQVNARGFNEAGGFLPRKLPALTGLQGWLDASMRPGDFSPGNYVKYCILNEFSCRFNEAGGFLPRKPRASSIELLAPALRELQ